MIINFIQNSALLISLSVLYGLIKWYKPRNEIFYQVSQGIWFGAVAVVAMMMPYAYSPGVIYDGRSVVLTLAGLFGGGYTALVSVLMAGAYRIYLGGSGIWAGLATILFCSLTGLFFRRLFKSKLENIQFIRFVVIGIIAHFVMLASQLLLPETEGFEVISRIWLPVLLVLPVTFAVIAKLFQLIGRYIQSEQKIREAESLYRTTLLSIGDAVICTDNQGIISQMNAVAEQLTGWKFADAKEKKLNQIFRIINEETRGKVESPFVKVLQSGSIVGLANHTLLISKDGRETPIADSGAPIKNEKGEITGVVLVFRDQTEEREYQKKIAQSETQYRELVESTDAIAWEYDILIDKWIYVAPQVTEKLGWLPEEWTNLDFWKNNIHPEEQESAANYCFACAAQGEQHSLEYRFKSKDGKYIWLRDVVAVEMHDNQPVKLRGVMFDITERKNMEIGLQEKNTFIQTVLDNLPIGIALNKIDEGTAYYMNRRFEEIYGWKTSELKDIPSFFEKVYPDEEYRSKVVQMIMEGIESGDPQKMHWEDIQITRSDGSKGFVNAINIPLSQQNTMVSTVMDITSRTLAEKELKESEERFRKAVLLAPIPIMVHDEDGNVINLSEGWNHFSGYSIEEIPTLKAWTEKAFGEKAEEVENYVTGMFDENKTIVSGEFEIIAKSGEKRIWNFYTTPLGKLQNGKKIMLSMAPDITEGIKVKKELEESEQTYRHLFENHTAVKLLIDPENGQIVKANQAAADFYGWEIEKLQAMNIGEINTLSPEKIREALVHAHTNSRVYFEFKHRLLNGQIRDVEVFSSRIENGGKELLHSIVHDVTDKKRLFEELVVAKEKAEESERLKTAFLANMSHEIRTPLNGILGFTNLLADDEHLTQIKKKEFAAIINKSSEGLLKIINDILDISRLETNKSGIVVKPFEAGNALSTVYTIFEKKMKDSGKNNVDLILTKPDVPLVLNTDETRLIQIFSNLLDNAIRFTPKGSVTFGISKQNENKVEFFVADTGVGIPKEKHGVIFDRFSQADNHSSRSYGGTGLGLAIVKKLLELMGSEITIESEPGQGACFRFQLPFLTLNKTEDEASVKKTDAPANINKSRILVVEDDSVSRIYFSQILVNHSSELFFAETGKEALQLFESQNPDIILMDIGLPDMSGLEVVRKIREKDKHVIIIAQTAYAMPDDKQKALEAGCNDYIAKPVKTALLMEKMKQFNN